MATSGAELENHVEKFRLSNEPANHWEARKTFLLRNWEDYPEMQLISLSMVWANMEFDGCKYSPELMARVREMAGDVLVSGMKSSQLGSSSKLSHNQKTGVKVRGNGEKVNAKKAVIQETLAKRPHEKSLDVCGGTHDESLTKKAKLADSNVSTVTPVQNLVSATDVDGSTISVSTDTSGPLTVVYPLKLSAASSPDMVKKLSEVCAAFKTKSMENTPLDSLKQVFWQLFNSPDLPHTVEFTCERKVEKQNPRWKAHFITCNVLCATHISGSKKAAKDGVVSAVVNYWKDHDVIAMQESSLGNQCKLKYTHKLVYMQKLPSADEEFVDKAEDEAEEGDCTKPDQFQAVTSSLPHVYATHDVNCIINAAPKLPKFVLVELAGEAGKTESPIAKLVNSASMSKVPLEFIMDQYQVSKNQYGVMCTVVICSREIARGVAPGNKDAKFLAAHNAVQALKMTNVTLQKSTNSDGPAISRDELIDDPVKDETLPETNMGHKLLKMMGWTGEGGLGKKGEGIKTPVKATGSGSHTKEGLGFDVQQLKDPNTKRLDEGKVWQYLQDYARSGKEEELKFSTDLSQNERKNLHHMCAKLGLKSVSRGKGDNRYLTVGRKWDVKNLVKAVAQKGGSMGKYQLIGPSTE